MYLKPPSVQMAVANFIVWFKPRHGKEATITLHEASWIGSETRVSEDGGQCCFSGVAGALSHTVV